MGTKRREWLSWYIYIYIHIYIYICAHHVSYTTQVKSFGSVIFFGCCQVPQTWLSFRLVVVVVIGHVPRSGAQYRGPRCCGLVPFRPLRYSCPVVCNLLIPKVWKVQHLLAKVRQAVLKLLVGIILRVVWYLESKASLEGSRVWWHRSSWSQKNQACRLKWWKCVFFATSEATS